MFYRLSLTLAFSTLFSTILRFILLKRELWAKASAHLICGCMLDVMKQPLSFVICLFESAPRIARPEL
jgi:hypothetical protein